MLRIGIDGRALAGTRAGTGRYIFELCKHVDAYMPDVQFFIYSATDLGFVAPSNRWNFRVDPKPWARRIPSTLWLKSRCGLLCAEDHLDVFWASATFFPDLDKRIARVCTVYDIAHLVVPRTMKAITYMAFRLFFERDVRSADFVISISKGTATRLVQQFNIKSSAVILPSIGAEFAPTAAASCAETLNRLGLSGSFFLAVGTLEPRKNIPMLIDSFHEAKLAGNLSSHKLILAGGGGWKSRKLRQMIEKSSSEDVIWIGYVKDSDLVALYSACTAFVFPSLYEGFGMPVLEARVCGSNVIATDSPEIREAGGLGVTYIAPNRQDLIRALIQIAEQRSNTLPVPATTSWEDGAKLLAQVFRQAVSAQSLP